MRWSKLVLLEMRAEFGFDALVAQFERDAKALREAQLAYRDTKALRLTEGALAYALLAENRPTTISGGWRDAVATAGTGLQSADNVGYALRDATGLRERYRIPADFSDTPSWEIAACLNPYSAPLATLVALRSSPSLLDYLQAVSREFGQVSAMPFDFGEEYTLSSRQLSRSEVIVEQLSAMGTHADWLSAFVFFKTVADVPLVAHRAELWRRTAAGEWVYSSKPPAQWVAPENRLDHGAHGWLQRLLADPDPADEAARQLLFWHAPAKLNNDDIPSMGKRSASRLKRALEQAKTAALRERNEPELAAARALMSRNLGRAIAVPLAALASSTHVQNTKGQWLDKLEKVSGGAISQIL